MRAKSNFSKGRVGLTRYHALRQPRFALAASSYQSGMVIWGHEKGQPIGDLQLSKGLRVWTRKVTTQAAGAAENYVHHTTG